MAASRNPASYVAGFYESDRSGGNVTADETTPILGRSYSQDHSIQFGNSRYRDNSFQHIDHGTTFLANPLAASTEIENVDNITTIALHEVKTKVYKPYTYLLKLVAWQPVFGNRLPCAKLLNALHVILVTLVIFLGYVLQIAACFRRDRIENESERLPNATYKYCENFLFSQYIVPDIIHSVAYFYSLYVFRIECSEQLIALINTVFLQASPDGCLSQKKLIKQMRITLILGLLWICVSFITIGMYMIAKYDHMMFTWMHVSDKATKVILICLLMAGLIMLDLVYITVVINYCVQCSLVVFFFEGLIEKITQHALDLQRAIQDIGEGKRYITTLNHSTATAMSLVLFNFGTMVILAILAFLQSNKNFTILMYVSTFVSMIIWFVIFITPLFLAAKLTSTCGKVHLLGNDLRMRPFVFADIEREELDSFLLYTSTLNMKAKIFQVPVKYSYIFFVLVFMFFCLLLLFQTGVIHIYIGDHYID